jgi:hypothetical protein
MTELRCNRRLVNESCTEFASAGQRPRCDRLNVQNIIALVSLKLKQQSDLFLAPKQTGQPPYASFQTSR